MRTTKCLYKKHYAVVKQDGQGRAGSSLPLLAWTLFCNLVLSNSVCPVGGVVQTFLVLMVMDWNSFDEQPLKETEKKSITVAICSLALIV